MGDHVDSGSQHPSQFMEILGRIAYEAYLMKPLLPTYVHLLISAIFPIFTASHAALSRPPSAAPRIRKKDDESGDGDQEDDEIVQKIESLSPSDAIIFPILAGLVLASLYFILKWLQDPAWLNWALGMYFSFIGFFFAFRFVRDVLSVSRSYIFPKQYSSRGHLWTADDSRHIYHTNGDEVRKKPIAGPLRHLLHGQKLISLAWSWRIFIYNKATLKFQIRNLIKLQTQIDVQDLVSILVSVGVVAFHQFIDKPWYLTNFLGFSFCYGSLQFMSPTTVWTGTLILCALFFYDIYFVFFTPMMVTVATKLDVPIKLLFPKPDGCVMPLGASPESEAMQEYLRCLAKKKTMAMLGLGDIVVPGMIMAFALRFDLYLFYLRQQKTSRTGSRSDEGAMVVVDNVRKPTYLPATGGWGERFWTKEKVQPREMQAKRFPKVYFYATIVGYLAGMIATILVMQVWQHAQPALLYLVPGVLGSFWGTALVRREVKLLWNYTEAPEEDGSHGQKEKNANAKAREQSETTKPQMTIEGDSTRDSNDPSTSLTLSKANGNLKPPNPASTTGNTDKDPPISSSTDQSRELFLFSITLPKPRETVAQIEAAPASNQPKPAIVEPEDDTTAAEDKQNDEQEEEKGDTIEVVPEKSQTRSTGRRGRKPKQDATVGDRGDGEPPGKRRRRG